MELCTLASGSSGNAMVVRDKTGCVLLDAGISARRITAGLRALGIAPEALSAILITHAHTDHTSGLAVLTKKRHIPILATSAAARQICRQTPALEGKIQPMEAGDEVQIGALWCRSFPTPHDAAGSVGYTIAGEDGSRMALCTDLGHVTSSVRQWALGCDLLAVETNHDEDWVRSGPYPYPLKQRILGELGHLSNEAGAELAAQAVASGTRTVLLSHLSAQNNTPAHAYEVVSRRLRGAGIDPARDLTLAVSPRGEPGPVYRLARGKTEALA